jgi:IstB-like ATP binding protein
LLRLQRQLAGYKLLIIDELGYVPLSQTGAELLFEVFSQRYERVSTVVTSNLPFDEWTSGALVEPAERGAARRAIAQLYAWDATTRERGRKTDKATLIALIRLREIERLLQRRHGRALLPDDDDGRDSLELVAHHVAHLGGEVENHITAWAARWCPWLPQHEAAALAERVAAHPQKFKAATLGWRLRLTEIERAALAITTIRAFNVTDEQMAERRRQRDRAGRPEPVSRAKPWENEGVSRATWYRRRRETKNVGSRVEVFAADEICLTPGVRSTSAGHPKETITITTIITTSQRRARPYTTLHRGGAKSAPGSQCPLLLQ